MKQISMNDIAQWRAEHKDFQLIDVREPFEFEIVNIKGLNIPLNRMEENLSLIQRDGPVVMICKSGGRSKSAIALLQSQHGFTNLLNLKGGILQWIEEVDRELSKY